MRTSTKYFVTDRGGWDGGTLLGVTCNHEYDGQDAWDDGFMEEMRMDFSPADGFVILSFNDACDGALVLREDKHG